jgi:hypothetical protein
MAELSVTTLAFAGKEGLVRGRPHACICVSLCTRDEPSNMPLPGAPEQALSTRHNVAADGSAALPIQGSTLFRHCLKVPASPIPPLLGAEPSPSSLLQHSIQPPFGVIL